MNYSEMHRKSVSPILHTTIEDRKILENNKENYIQYLEKQLEKAATMVYKKYEQRMRGVEQLIADHDEKLQNFVKLIKLLQNFAETQEQENTKITRHVNTKFEELYHNQLKDINQKQHETQYRLEILEKTQSNNQQLIFDEFQKSTNLRIDHLMNEIQQNELKVNYQSLEQRIANLETQIDKRVNIEDTEKLNHDKLIQQEQLKDLKVVIENLQKEQDVLKNNIQNINIDINQQKILFQGQPQRESRKSVVQQSDGESMMKPKLSLKDNIRIEKKIKNKKSFSRPESNQKLMDKQNQRLNQAKTSKRGLLSKN